MKNRNRAQTMGYWLNEPAILNPRLIQDAMVDLAQSGYGIVRVMLRNSNFHHRSPQVVNAIKLAVEAGHANGLRVALDMEPHRDPIARDMGQKFPEAIGTRLVLARTRIVNGGFHLRLECPSTEAVRGSFEGVEAAFLRQAGRVDKLSEFTFDLTSEISMSDDRCLEQDYVFGRQYHQVRVWILSGKMDVPNGTELAVYGRVRDTGLVDFWSEGLRTYYEMALECYRDIALDGAGWDEPAVGGDWTNYRYGAAFAAEFERRNGYQLADRLWLLDEPGMTAESMRVRVDYYQTLNEGVYAAQKNFFDKATALFGADILRGTHHTWQGEGGINDYRAGAVDYFRLNDNMDAGYTDCWWWDMGSVSYAYALGSSLGRLTPSGEAEINTWHLKPTNGQILYHARFMTLLDITWFNIWYGADADVCQYPTHYTWPQNLVSMRRHRDDQARLGDLRPVIDVAIWHGWEGVTAVNLESQAGAHKTFCINTAQLFLERNLAFDFIDTRLLETGEVRDGRFVTALGRHRVLVLPYAVVFSRLAWDRCVAFSRAGGKVVFVGPPPKLDTEGKALGEEFAALLAMPRVTLADYQMAVDAASPRWSGRPEKIDVSFPISGDANRIIVSVEGESHGIRSPDGNVIYLSDLDPRLRLLDLLTTLIDPEVECFSDSIQWRLYRGNDRSVLVCIARKDREMAGIIRFAGHEIEFKRGTVAFVEEGENEPIITGEDLEFVVR